MNKNIKRFLNRKIVRQILGEEYNLTDIQIIRLDAFFLKFGSPKQCENWLLSLAFMVKYNLSNYVGRVRRLKKLPASPDKLSMMLRYGKYWKEHHTIATENRTKLFKNTVKYWLTLGYCEEEAKLKISEVQTARSLKSPVTQGGTSEYTCRSIVYWIKQGYSEVDAKKEVSRVQARCKTPEQIQRWLTTLNNKSDKEKELINLKKGHGIESYIAKGYSEKDAIEAALKFSQKQRQGFSKISQKLFDMLNDEIPINTFYYKNKNYEKMVGSKYVDFYDVESGIVIEFLGDFWHRNPLKYEPDFYVLGLTSKEIWKKDELRKEKILQDKNVKQIIEIWESEFRTNPRKVIDNIVRSLYDGRKSSNS